MVSTFKGFDKEKINKPALSLVEKKPKSFLDEFRESAIPDRLTLVNVQWVEGDEAIQILTEEKIAQSQRVTEYVTRATKRILDEYEFASLGGWVAYGCNLDGSAGSVPCFKPVDPRRKFENGKLKLVKYETPMGCPALPLQPYVDAETAQSIYEKYDVEPESGETFWQV